jgi:hypothetical protein
MVGRTAGHETAGHLSKAAAQGSGQDAGQDARFGKTESGKAQRRAAAEKIRKMIRKCKADAKGIRQLDDEQAEYLQRLRKNP